MWSVAKVVYRTVIALNFMLTMALKMDSIHFKNLENTTN